MLEVRPLQDVGGVAESGFFEGTCKGSLPLCAAGVPGVEVDRVADEGVESVRLEEGALVFGVGEAPKVLRGRCCCPCNSFSASKANWNNLSTVLKSL